MFAAETCVAPTATARASAHRAVAPAPRRVLVVDDHPAVARIMSQMLEQCGYTAAIAHSAAGFCGQFDAADADVVLLDLSLPGGDGVELMKFLAERRSDAAVIIVSGCDRRVLEAAMRMGLALGLNMGTPLMKPVRVGELDQALRAVSSNEGGIRHDLCV